MQAQLVQRTFGHVVVLHVAFAVIFSAQPFCLTLSFHYAGKLLVHGFVPSWR